MPRKPADWMKRLKWTLIPKLTGMTHYLCSHKVIPPEFLEAGVFCNLDDMRKAKWELLLIWVQVSNRIQVKDEALVTSGSEKRHIFSNMPKQSIQGSHGVLTWWQYAAMPVIKCYNKTEQRRGWNSKATEIPTVKAIGGVWPPNHWLPTLRSGSFFLQPGSTSVQNGTILSLSNVKKTVQVTTGHQVCDLGQEHPPLKALFQP